MESYQIDLNHIHNKMIFDCFNELLDTKRVFGLQGEPYPNKFLWRLKKEIKNENFDFIIKKCIEELMDFSTFMCGFIKDKDDSFVQILANLDEDVVKQIKEERLGKLVAKDLSDFEKKICMVEEEEFEICYCLSEDIFDFLIEDLIKDFV